ncbi:hypothetical protein E2C01_088840 [Portunus trituberculatus]|uniref:Endonuclease/exonuclease/phosphatase domain-containing protein n=1 Tax=Portunus trituberculatus TaxID=210409 RepID=A0A5B7JAE9_PORTR|nr:hypothetical protein [Portunus trituberculatus]
MLCNLQVQSHKKPEAASHSPISGRHPAHRTEAFVGHPPEGKTALARSGYVAYVHPVRNGLITYVHSSLQHRLFGSSNDHDTTFQLLELTVGLSKVKLCNVYSARVKLNTHLLPPPPDCVIIYIGDFNARYPELSDVSQTPNRSGVQLLRFVRRHHLTRWDCGRGTHAHQTPCVDARQTSVRGRTSGRGGWSTLPKASNITTSTPVSRLQRHPGGSSALCKDRGLARFPERLKPPDEHQIYVACYQQGAEEEAGQCPPPQPS